jgi:hypothetical protein
MHTYIYGGVENANFYYLVTFGSHRQTEGLREEEKNGTFHAA